MRWCLAMLLCLSLAAPSFGQSRETFYRQRKVAGERAALQGDLATAARELEIAAFGMLEDPPALAATLLTLAEVQQSAGDQESFVETALRLIDLDDQFEVYEQLPSSLQSQKAAFEAALKTAAVPLAGTRFQERLEAPSDEQATEAVPTPDEPDPTAAEPPPEGGSDQPSPSPPPDDPDPSQQVDALRTDLLAEAAKGNARRARKAARDLLRLEPEDLSARCLLTALDRSAPDCREILHRLESCTAPELRNLITEAHLDCADRLRDPGLALDRLEIVTPEERRRFVREEKRARRLTGRERSEEQRGSDGQVEPATDGVTENEPTPEATAATGADAARVADSTERPIASGNPTPENESEDPTEPLSDPPVEADELTQLSTAESAARSVEDLEALWDQALTLVERSPSTATHRVVGRLAYRTGRWASAIRFLTLDGRPEAPASQFYLAVSLHQVGFYRAAAEALEQAESSLQRTPFVLGWIERIRNAAQQP